VRQQFPLFVNPLLMGPGIVPVTLLSGEAIPVESPPCSMSHAGVKFVYFTAFLG
jgi:hypothetical protein